MQVNWRENWHVIVSGAVHTAICAVMLILSLLTVKRFEAEASAGMPVDVISMSEFNQMMKATTAPPKQIVEKKGESKPVQIRDAEISDMPEIVAPAPQASPPPPPPPETKPPEPQKEAAKPPPAAAEKPLPPEKTPEQLEAEALQKAAQEKARAEAAAKRREEAAKKREEAKRREEAKKIEEAKKREEEQKRAEQERKRLALLAEQKPPSEDKSNFDSSAIQQLLDKRKPRRMAATGDTVNTTASAPAAGAAGASMTGNDWNRFVARMQQCWTPPDGQDVRSIAVVLRIRMNKDGTLAAAPQLVDRPSGAGFQVAADAALRAVTGCAPYTFMPAAKYDAWKDFEINFDPKNINRG